MTPDFRNTKNNTVRKKHRAFPCSLFCWVLLMPSSSILFRVILRDIVGEQLVGVVYFIVFGIHLGLLVLARFSFGKSGGYAISFFVSAFPFWRSVYCRVFQRVLPDCFWYSHISHFPTTVWVALDVLLENYSKDNLSGRIRGFYLMVMNIGFLLAPYLSTQILSRLGIRQSLLSCLSGI
jgi:hypothetical protein